MRRCYSLAGIMFLGLFAPRITFSQATMRLMPIPAQGTDVYPDGTFISENEIIAPFGGFRAYFHVQVTGWDPSGQIGLRAYEAYVSLDEFLGADANPPQPDIDLQLAIEDCAGCFTDFGEPSSCVSGFCEPVFITRQRPDFVFFGVTAGEISAWDSGITSTRVFFAFYLTPNHPGYVDDGTWQYCGTMVLDIPSEAVGSYTIDINEDTTFLTFGDGSAIFPDLIPAVITIIPPPEPDATSDKTRFVSFSVPEGDAPAAMDTALRVRLVSLHHVVPPYTGGASVPFTGLEGQVRWVGPPTQYVESSASGIPFNASQLQCAPHYQDWSTVGLLHVTGSAITPSSIYEVENVAASCVGIEDTCTAVSAPLSIATTRWGDVRTPYNPPDPSVQPDISDVSALVDKFRSAPGAPIKARGLLAGAPGNPFGEITHEVLNVDFGFSHISACVDAFRGVPYPYAISGCP